MTEIYNTLLKNKITPNQLYYLHCLQHKTVPHNFINITLEADRLSKDNWIKDGKITTKTTTLLENIDSYFRKSKKETNSDIMGSDFYAQIEQYRELFPNIKLPSGKPARTNVKTLESLFRWFFTNYTYNWETILRATKQYLDEYENKNWAYMRTSQYFIKKQNPDKTFDSDLANYCDMVLNGLEPEDSHFKENIV